MISFPDNREEALLQLQTRMIPMPDGRQRMMTYTMLVWRAMDYLIDRRYCTLERLIAHANADGWDPPNAPFEMRFSSVIAYWTGRYSNAYRDYDAYCRGEI